MYYYMDNDYQSIINTLQSIISIIGIIALCKMYSDCGHSWWKALIPFYSTYVFGQIVFDEERGKKGVKYEITAVVLGILSVISLLAAIAGYDNGGRIAGTNPGNFWFMTTLLIVIAIVVVGILDIINRVCMRAEYLELAGLENWLNVVWFFFPALTQIYLAFFANRQPYTVQEPINEYVQQEPYMAQQQPYNAPQQDQFIIPQAQPSQAQPEQYTAPQQPVVNTEPAEVVDATVVEKTEN